MDLHDFLNNSIMHMKKEEVRVVIGSDPSIYKELHKIAFSRVLPISWRAIWVMDYTAEEHPHLADEYIPKIWREVPKKHPDGVLRSALRLLVRYDIPEEFQGIATDLCLEWIEKESVPVAIKAYSMNILLKIATIYPEISNEIITILEAQAPNNSGGFKARAKQVISELKKL